MEVTFVNSVEFCTQNDLRYHATCGDSVTLECSAKNYDVLRWSKGQSNTAIDLSDPNVSMNGTNLRISPVSVEDRGEYKCIAENKYFTAQDISATLEVYCEYLPSLPPSLPPSLLPSFMRIRVCMCATCVYVYACTVRTCTCMHVQYMHIRVCMYSTCAYLYVQCMHDMCVYVYTCVLHVSTCMHVRYIRVRVCMYSTCIYVFACIVHVCTCMHVAHMHTRTRIYRTHTRIYACTVHVQYMHVHVCM